MTRFRADATGSTVPDGPNMGAASPDEDEARRSETSRAVDSALRVAGVLGWPVFPVHGIKRGRCTCGNDACGSPGKHPRTHRGVTDATTDVSEIDAWDARWPESNWAATPGKSGVVIDVDARSGGFDSIGPWGLESSWSVFTGGGGRHLFFTLPEGEPPVANRTNWLPGVDVKGNGGYVVLPGSAHVSGGFYRWLTEPPSVAPPPASRDLLDSIRQGAAGGPGGDGLPDTDSILSGVEEGARDNTLFRAACRWRRQLGDNKQAVMLLALHAAASCEPPFPQDQAIKCVESAFRQEHDVVEPWMTEAARSLNTPPSVKYLDTMRAALLSPEDLDSLPDPEWLIDRVITTSSMSVLYGSPGLGKTFLALDWAMRIGVGLKWMDRPVKEGRVLYVYAEGVHGLKQRRAAWVESTGVLGSEVRFFPRAVPLLDDDWATALAALCAEMQPALVVIDTLARATAGADENSVKDMSLAVRACDKVREASGAAVMLVHHTGKDGSNYRGSSAIEGAADTMLHLARKDDGTVELRCTKQKDAEEFDPIPMQLESVGPSAVIVPGVSTQAFVQDAVRSQLVSILAMTPGEWKTAKDVHAAAGGKQDLRTTQRRLAEMVEAGLIERAQSGKSHVFRVASGPTWA